MNVQRGAQLVHGELIEVDAIQLSEPKGPKDIVCLHLGEAYVVGIAQPDGHLKKLR